VACPVLEGMRLGGRAWPTLGGGVFGYPVHVLALASPETSIFADRLALNRIKGRSVTKITVIFCGMLRVKFCQSVPWLLMEISFPRRPRNDALCLCFAQGK
jgi:hypothetical protein